VNHDDRFLRETIVDVDAAVVGISSDRWTKVDSEHATPDAARTVMVANRFDVLPIVGPSSVREYFRTTVWGKYESIERHAISHRDLIALTTSVRDVIRGFVGDSREFYFLTSDRRVVGLISLVNLNSRPVKVWLFGLLSELESELGAFLMVHVSESELLGRELGPGTSKRGDDIRARYTADRAKGVDAALVEYLYLSDLINFVAKRKLFDRLGYKSRAAFEKHFNPMNELRNLVAHPLRSLITDRGSCAKLWTTLDHVEHALFNLRAA
jgi:hypothetical protein